MVPILTGLLLASLTFAGPVAKPDPAEALWETLVKGATHKDDPDAKKLVGTKLTLVGWIIPNEYDRGELVSFLLARYPGGCVHVPLPPPENVVHVTMRPKAKRLKNVTLTTRVKVEGVLTTIGRVDASYEMEADSVKEAD